MRRSLVPAGLASLLILLAPPAPLPLFGGAAVGGPAAALLAAAERRAHGGDPAGALTDYEQIVKQFPETPQAPEALLRIARVRRAAGARAEALDAVERLVTRYPGAPQAAAGLVLEGRVRSEMPTGIEDLEGARKTLEKTWLLFPRLAYPALQARSAARVLDGELALRLGRDTEATTSFLEVVEMEPASPATAEAYVGLGTAFVRAGDWRAAAESFQSALAASGASADTLALARRRLALLERRLLRPATGAELWIRARSAAISGAQPKRLAGVAADEAGRLLIVDSADHAVMLLSPAGAVEGRWQARDAEKPAWSRDARAYVGAGDSVILPGETGRRFRQPGRDRDLEGIRAVERGPFGEWIVLASKSVGVVSYPEGTGAGRTLVGSDGDPIDLATDALGRLYVLERKAKRVVRVGREADRPETVVRGAWRQAAALAVDPFGWVHVLDGDGRVHTYDPAGEAIAAVGPILPGGLELRRAQDLAAGGDGRLFIADSRSGLIVLE